MIGSVYDVSKGAKYAMLGMTHVANEIGRRPQDPFNLENVRFSFLKS